MTKLNLKATNESQKRIKDYLEQNASETLADKINYGTEIEKDGKTLVNKKTLDGFMKFATNQARELAEKGSQYACVEDATVFGWAIHYFEEDSIEEKLYHEDGTEYQAPKPKKADAKKPTKKTEDKKPEPKPEPKPQEKTSSTIGKIPMAIKQVTIFDL